MKPNYNVVNLNPTETSKDWKNETSFLAGGSTSKCARSGDLPPWMKDGILFFGLHTGTYEAERSWKIRDAAHTPILQRVADFYTLEAIATQIPQGNVYVPSFNEKRVLELVKAGHIPVDRSSPEIISLWAMYLQAQLIESLAPLLRNYLYYACAGEAAHHYFFQAYLSPCSEEGGRWWWRKITNRFGGEKSSRWLMETFQDGKNEYGGTNWTGGWGGMKWADAAKVLHHFETGVCGTEKFTAKNFCDRVFSLQHNNGTILSKVTWNDLSQATLASILDAHHNGHYTVLRKYSSPTVQMLWDIAKDNLFFFTGFNWGNFDYPRPATTEPTFTPDEDEDESTGCKSAKGFCDDPDCVWCNKCDEAMCDCMCCTTCECYPCQCCTICHGDPEECECCGACGEQECECCSECGQTGCSACDTCTYQSCDCKCCSSCDSYPCECCGCCDCSPCECGDEEDE